MGSKTPTRAADFSTGGGQTAGEHRTVRVEEALMEMQTQGDAEALLVSDVRTQATDRRISIPPDPRSQVAIPRIPVETITEASLRTGRRSPLRPDRRRACLDRDGESVRQHLAFVVLVEECSPSTDTHLASPIHHNTPSRPPFYPCLLSLPHPLPHRTPPHYTPFQCR